VSLIVILVVSGVREERDLFVRLVDSQTRQVRKKQNELPTRLS
jgi:hypothetical protein